MQQKPYPVRFSVDYPDHSLDKTSTALRVFWAIPILIILGAVSGGAWSWLVLPAEVVVGTRIRRAWAHCR